MFPIPREKEDNVGETKRDSREDVHCPRRANHPTRRYPPMNRNLPKRTFDSSNPQSNINQTKQPFLNTFRFVRSTTDDPSGEKLTNLIVDTRRCLQEDILDRFFHSVQQEINRVCACVFAFLIIQILRAVRVKFGETVRK